MAWAQTMALARASGIALHQVEGGGWSQTDERLRRAWRRLGQEGWLEPWRPYVDCGNGGAPEDAGRAFLDGASGPIRKLRNGHAHAFHKEVWGEELKALEEPLLFLLDAAVLWADRPLQSRFYPIPGGGGRWRAVVMRGSGWPWPEEEFHIRDVGAEGFDPAHVYIRWNRPDGAPFLLDLWPFVTVEEDVGRGRRVVQVISHFDGRRWWRKSLQDGKASAWREPPGEALAVLDGVGAALPRGGMVQ